MKKTDNYSYSYYQYQYSVASNDNEIWKWQSIMKNSINQSNGVSKKMKINKAKYQAATWKKKKEAAKAANNGNNENGMAYISVIIWKQYLIYWRRLVADGVSRMTLTIVLASLTVSCPIFRRILSGRILRQWQLFVWPEAIWRRENRYSDQWLFVRDTTARRMYSRLLTNLISASNDNVKKKLLFSNYWKRIKY